MNAPHPVARFPLAEEPLGLAVDPDQSDYPSPAEWDALWIQALREPVPDYSGVTLRRFVAERKP